jgi:hypothetical protein
VGKKTSSRKKMPPKTSHKPPTSTGGDAAEMVLVPSGFAWTRQDQSDFRLIATQGPGTSVAGPEMADSPRGSGAGLPVFTLVPRPSYVGKLPADDLLPPAEQRTRAYGGHDLVISGSMSDGAHGPPSFTLVPATKRIQGPSKPYTKTKRTKE